MLSSFLSKRATPPEVYTLSLHDALPISNVEFEITLPPEVTGAKENVVVQCRGRVVRSDEPAGNAGESREPPALGIEPRSEEHTSELQSRQYLVCRLLLEKKQKTNQHRPW